MTTLLADRYRLTEQRLGRGGMGEVFAGRDERLGRPVAIKFMLKEWKEADLARFAQEARVLAALQHPNIVNILDAHVPEKEGDAPFFVMEMLAGRSLADELERTPRIEPQRLLRIAIQVASALSAAHDAGVVHRDLKPSNIMLTDPNGPAETAKVIDFGVARNLDAAALTVTGSIIGTPAYMSPEQALGRRVGPLSDIYSLGALLYHAFVGEPPFKGEAFAAIAVQVAGPEEATMDPALRSGELGAFATLILECLAKDPGRRPASAAIVGERLRSLLTRAAATTTPPPRARDDVNGGAPVPSVWKPAPTGAKNGGKPTSLWWVVLAVVVVAIGSIVTTQALLPAAHPTARPTVSLTWTPPPAPTAPRSGGSTEVAALYRESGWTCARMRRGEVYCWGDQDRNAVPRLAPVDHIVGLGFAGDGILFETSSGKLGWWRPWAPPTFGFWARGGRLGGCSYRECYITGEDGAAYAIRTEFREGLDKATHNCGASNSPCDLPDTWSKIPAPTNGPVTDLVVFHSLGAVALIDGSPYLKDAKDDGGWAIVGGVGPLESLESASTISMVPRGPTLAIKRKSSRIRELLAFDGRTRLPTLSALPAQATGPCEVRAGAVWCDGKQERVVPAPRSGESIVYAKRGRDFDSVDPRAGHVGWNLCVELVDASQERIRFACGSSDSTVPF